MIKAGLCRAHMHICNIVQAGADPGFRDEGGGGGGGKVI